MTERRADAFWEISGPRKYLNIPTPAPDKWRAAMTFGNFPKCHQVVGWGPTEDAAKLDAIRLADGERRDDSKEQSK